jgi:hypothetical protein
MRSDVVYGDGSFCFFLQKEALFFFEKKNQKTLIPAEA